MFNERNWSSGLFRWAKLVLENTSKSLWLKRLKHKIDVLPDDIDAKCEYPEHQLFMFSILSGWDEMAKLFCKVGNVRAGQDKFSLILNVQSQINVK